MSGCAFSISSSSTTEYGLRFTFSVSWPPSSWPTYPGGEPISFDTECFSMYSDMSKRISAFSLPNRNCASARASSVLPTPVGPRNMKLPTGRFGFLSPARERRMARDTAEMARSWLITRRWSSSSMRSSLSLSSWLIDDERHAGPLRDDLVDLGSCATTTLRALERTSNFSRTNCRFSRATCSCSR